MTVNAINTRIAYAGDGATRTFAVPFPFFNASDLIVLERTINTGSEKLLTPSIHYSVSGGEGGPGTVTLTNPPAAGTELHVRRQTPLTQLVDYTPHDPFPAQTHEQALDRAVLRDQELKEVLDQALKFPVTDAGALTSTLPPAPLRARKAVIFDAQGNVGVSVDNYTDQVASVTAAANAAAASATTASTAASTAQTAATSAQNAASTATNQAGSAATSATSASGSASAASTSASNAAVSANAASSSASSASASAATATQKASEAAASAASINISAVGNGSRYLRQKSDESGFEYRTSIQVLSDLVPAMSGHAHELLFVNTAENGVDYATLPVGFDNLLLNGGFRIWQLGTSFTNTSAWPGYPTIADGWQLADDIAGGVVLSRQVSGARTYLRLTRLGGYSTQLVTIRQRLKTSAVQAMIGKTATLSFDLSGSALSGATLTVFFVTTATETGTSGAITRATQTFTSISTGFTRRTMTITLPADSTDQGAFILLRLSSLSSIGQCNLSDIDLRLGTATLPFQNRPDPVELALCQEQIWKSYPQGVAPGTANATTGRLGWNTFAAGVLNHSGLSRRVPTLRATPTAYWFSDVTGTYGQLRDNAAGADVAVTQVLETSDGSTGYPQTAAIPTSGAWVTGHVLLIATL